MTHPDPNDLQISPLDEHNRQLLSYVRPADWVNPAPAPLYDLVVIGAGTAGLVVAAGAAGLGLGLKIALVEKQFMGGDCLNFGCVPSKAIIRAARLVMQMRRAHQFGIEAAAIKVDFPAIMQRMRKLRAGIAHHDSVQRFQQLGIDVFLGNASFIKAKAIEVDGKILHYKKAIIATGARAAIPQIDGIEAAGYYTNETIFSLTQLPQRLAIVGGGPIGCELAQAFQQFGSEVVLIHQHDRVLNKEDIDAATIVQKTLIDNGIRLILNANIDRIETNDTGKTIHYRERGIAAETTVDAILIAAGRTPNVEGLNLEAVGVEYNRTGVKVNDYLQTTNPKIYAAGDVCLDWKFTHAADAAARIVIKNTLFSPFGLGRSKLSNLVMPWVTYTEPEVAHVGMDERSARANGLKVNAIEILLENVDRAILDSETEGFVKILHQQGSDKILGATIVAPHAGEMISELTTAMVNNLGLNALSSTIHPYPTQADSIKKAADAYRRTLLTPRSKRLLGWLQKLS